ncbi:MAG: Rieske (2Fe-2S) protein [Chloroflexota bacterium]|nr:Rieske (2Fe-2S) protein [Chloroflexota bacterium]
MPDEAATLEVAVGSLRRGRIYSFEARGRPVIVFWAKDRLVVASEVCPHIGGPLGQARLEDDGCAIRCPWHGYKFDTESGAFLENPNEQYIQQRVKTHYSSYRPGPVNFRLNLLPFEIKDGILRI